MIIIDENSSPKTTYRNIIDSEPPGYFKIVISPMLNPGHELELITWLKTVGIIHERQICDNYLFSLSNTCKKFMSWERARNMDNFVWKCSTCNKKKSIRENSILKDIKCTFKNILFAILFWTKNIDSDTVSEILNIRKQVVISIYKLCAKVSTKHIKKNKTEWQLGGPGLIVLVQVYPSGFSHFTTINSPNSLKTPILCLAEVKSFPPRHYYRSLNRYSTPESIQIANQTAIDTIKEIVCPGTILVCSYSSTVCSFESLQSLKDIFPTIISTEILKKFDNEKTTLAKNLETIYATAARTCEEVQSYNTIEINDFLISEMWRQRFENESFAVLINQFFDC